MAKKKAPARKASPRAGHSANGMKTFSLHAFDKAAASMLDDLRDERAAHPAFAMGGAAGVTQLDAETVAKRYLKQALDSKAVPALTAPKSGDSTSEFKSLGTETVPLTGTTNVKFRQSMSNIPVYGSLVTVELDEDNNLVSMNSSLGEPEGVSPIAKLAPAEAVKAVAKLPQVRNVDGIVPQLNYYYDAARSKWRLAFILEDVPVSHLDEAFKPGPQWSDFVVDAMTGSLITELPRTPSMASTVENAVDGKNQTRQIRVEVTGSQKLMKDATLNVQTFDFKFSDPVVNETKLPGTALKNPPKWTTSAVSAHANAEVVAGFLRNVLKRNNIDNKGGAMNSSINCVVKAESSDGKEWFNAFWDGKQMVYGQVKNGTSLVSLAVDLDVVGHEMFHGVTDASSRLEYALQSGAMNESYSDIFGVIIANLSNPDIPNWNWEIGAGLDTGGKPFRDMRTPTLFGQPDNMKNFKKLPNTAKGDWGGVHTNSGIHNKAAYNILTAIDAAKKLIFTAQEVAAVFYVTLTQQLSRTSQFSDSRRGALIAAQSLFRTQPPAQLKQKLDAITAGFGAVGIV
ncbi:MAG: M4 family metallopeptidase [Candidatus Solibacter sp.]